MPGSFDFSWLQVLAAALGGGLTVKLIDIVYQEVRRRSDNSLAATRFVDEHLDPLLKAADEVVGKLVSLALEDFRPLAGVEINLGRISNNDVGSLLYLISRFWARIEIIRQQGLAVAISKDQRGRDLQNFLACLESTHVRIVDRISQRAIGELLTVRTNDQFQTLGYVEFVRRLETDEEMRRWIGPLAAALSKLNHTADRQRVLQYGVVVHALIDALDPEHAVTNKRPSYPTKLSRRTARDLKYRVFGVYLKGVPDRSKYLPKSPQKG